MVAPGIALAFWNRRDALLKDRRHAARQMQIEGRIGRRD